MGLRTTRPPGETSLTGEERPRNDASEPGAALQTAPDLSVRNVSALLRPLAVVIGLVIRVRIDDERQRSFVTGYPGPTVWLQDYEGIRARMRAERRQQVAVGGQILLPWRLSRSVVDAVDVAGADFALPADYARLAAVGGM